jgi:hypothetical protein
LVGEKERKAIRLQECQKSEQIKHGLPSPASESMNA